MEHRRRRPGSSVSRHSVAGLAVAPLGHVRPPASNQSHGARDATTTEPTGRSLPYFTRILLLPTGSFEYHGTELPPDTDSVIATGVALGLAATLGSASAGAILALPAVNYGFSVEHTGQPLTVVISHPTFYSYLRELTFSLAQPHDLLVVVNGHGGNIHSLGALEGDFNASFQDRKMFFPPIHPPAVEQLCVRLLGDLDVHAGSVEASLVAYYTRAPAREYTVSVGEHVSGSLRFFRSTELAPEGVIARHERVTADPSIGQSIHEAIVREITDSVQAVADRLGRFLARTADA